MKQSATKLSYRARSEPPAVTFPTFELSFYDHPTDITKFTVSVKLDPAWPAESRHHVTRQDMEDHFRDLAVSGVNKSSVAHLGQGMGHTWDSLGWTDTSGYLAWSFLTGQRYQAEDAAVHVDVSNMSLEVVYGAQMEETTPQATVGTSHLAGSASGRPSFYAAIFDSATDLDALQVAVTACYPNGGIAFGEDKPLETARKMLQDAVRDGICSLGKAAVQTYARFGNKTPVEFLYDEIEQVAEATISQWPQLHRYRGSPLSIDASRVTFAEAADTVHPEGPA